MSERRLSHEELVQMAVEAGELPATVRAGDVFRRVPMRLLNGERMDRLFPGEDHTLIKITGVPGGRRRRYSFVKLDPKPMGNGRRDRGEHRCALTALARHYALEPAHTVVQ